MSVRVLFIAGLGRSGSTLMDRLLGQVPGFCSVGELVFLWERGLLGAQLCGCGEPLPSCPFWKEVGDRAFGGWDRVDLVAMKALQHRVDRNRFVPWMLAPRWSPGYTTRMARYADTLAKLYVATAEVAGADVIVDSSKHVSTAALLRDVPVVDLRILHLVRDPRGVAYSWQKLVRKPEVVDRTDYMNRIPAHRVAARWVGYNLTIDLLRTRTPSLLVRFEDVVREPEAQLQRIAEFAGQPDADLGFISGDVADLVASHTVSGNPSRFQTGKVPIRPDEAWRSSLPSGSRRLVTALTAPSLLRYGYARRRG